MDDTLYTEQRLVALYDQLNAGDRDIRFYQAQIGDAPQRILDAGCGTGTFALTLAGRGHQVTGLDPAGAMLAAAQSRDKAKSVSWILGKAGDLPPDARFDAAVMTGHAFQCLLTDEEVQATMKEVRSRLARNGRFMFESRNPRIRPWERWNADASLRTVRDAAGQPVEVYHELIAVRGDLVSFRTHYRFHAEEIETHSTLRFLSQPAIERHLRAAGFSQIRCYGDWDGLPFSRQSPEIIVLAS